MEAQILRAGPSLMFMVEMRWSSRSSRRAWPSISCDRNWAANSSQPEQKAGGSMRWAQGFDEDKNPDWLKTPTLKRWDKAAHFLHAPLSRSGWEEVGSLSLEAPGSQAVGSSSAVASLGARVRRGRRQRGRIVLILVYIAGHVLWAARLGVALKFTASGISVFLCIFLHQSPIAASQLTSCIGKMKNYDNECMLLHFVFD